LSAVLIYLPLTAVFKVLQGHDITGNMFVELPAVGVLIAMMFLSPLVEHRLPKGSSSNGSQNRFDKTQSGVPKREGTVP
jgi:hypothetical protein